MPMKRLEDLNEDPLNDGDGIDWLEDQCKCHYAQQIENEYCEYYVTVQKKLFKPDSEFYATETKDSKCEKQNLLRVAQDQKHLSQEQRDQLCSVLSKYQELFEGTLGTWPDEEVTVELTKDAKPYHCGKPIWIPHIHLATLKKEVQHSVDIEALEEVNASESGPWCASSEDRGQCHTSTT